MFNGDFLKQGSEAIKSVLAWVVGAVLVLFVSIVAMYAFRGSKVIRATANSVILSSGLKLELVSVVKKTGDSLDPLRKEEWTPGGKPISARSETEESIVSASPATIDDPSLGPQQTRFLRFKMTSRMGSQVDICGFVPDSKFIRSKPVRSGTYRSTLNLGLDDYSNTVFEVVVGCREPTLGRYIVQVSDTNWSPAISINAVRFDGANHESKVIATVIGKITFSKKVYEDYSGPELHPNYVRILSSLRRVPSFPSTGSCSTT